MGFASLRTISFRNLCDDEVNLQGKDVFLVGENGQGKTNFLEALYFCSYASSFKGVRDIDMVKNGEKSCSAGVVLNGNNDSMASNLSISFRENEKKVMLDGKRLEDRKELLSIAPAIIFCHEDMEFVSGSPEKRRWFFDQIRSLWDPLYLDDLRRYRYVLKNRNALLRDLQKAHSFSESMDTAAMLGALDDQMAHYGIELCKGRRESAEEFSAIFEPLYRDISGIEGISIKYIPSWKQESKEEVLSYLAEKRDMDISFGLSNFGPHRDRYIFTRHGTEFSSKASTGQRRLLALLLRIAQTMVFSKKTGKKPVLLLDDVLLELDGEKRQKFLSVMPEYDQAFFTFLPIEPFENYRKSDTLVYYMENGKTSLHSGALSKALSEASSGALNGVLA